MSVLDRSELSALVDARIQEVLVIAAATPDARDLTHMLNELVGRVDANPDHADAAASAFRSLLHARRGELSLGTPGMVEILEFAMHHLRWRSVQAALSELALSDVDPRVRRAAERVLEAYEDDWPGGEIYDTA